MGLRPSQRGAALVAIAAILAIAVVTMLTAAIARSATGPRRHAVSDQALATAREALIAHATSRPIDDIVGPGYLPCPDLDDDGWAEPTCGSMTGETGQWQRLGRLPWKTLGLPDLRDAFGERLWYAVSSKHKGLLNCTVSPACLDMSPEAALGTITVRDATGNVIHDGTSASPYEPGTRRRGRGDLRTRSSSRALGRRRRLAHRAGPHLRRRALQCSRTLSFRTTHPRAEVQSGELPRPLPRPRILGRGQCPFRRPQRRRGPPGQPRRLHHGSRPGP